MVDREHGMSLEATVPEDTRVPQVGPPVGFPSGTQVADRFVVNRTLGRGSSGEVLAVQDLSLDREVAMKVLRGAGGPAIARFMREARITARLDHPGVPPVHTLEFLPDGGLLFTMRRLDGMTLGDALRRTAVGQPPAAIASVNAVVSLGLRVCEALLRAHFLGIIHRDVKPDNIMLGEHGEVALVDWGECRLLDEPDGGPAGSTVGTPAYMSPEQARGESADARSDVYALGATLYHVLTRCHPTWDEDPARFWDKKRAGTIEPLPREAAARVPRPLLAILQRALVADPAGRYASAAAFAADLERFQAGQAVEAYRESAPERLLRWARRHARGIMVTAAILTALVTTCGVLWREHLRQLADWGPPILSEDFSDDSWRKRWYGGEEGRWVVEDGRLVTRGKERSYLVLDRVLAGAVAIEYEGEMLPGCLPGDISVIWSEDPAVGAGHIPEGKVREYLMLAGCYDNYFCAIFRKPDHARIDERPFRLRPGVRHHFRVELDGNNLGMWIDGERVLGVEDRLPIGTGHLSLLGFQPGKAIDNIRVYQKRLPQVTSVIALGDAFMRQRLPLQAANAYREVAESHPGSDLAAEARYRQGLALREGGDLAAAKLVWQTLPPGEQSDRVAGHLLDQEMAAGRIREACAAMVGLYQRSPVIRSQLRAQWQSWTESAYQGNLGIRDAATARILVDVKIRLFPEHTGSDLECGNLLNQMGCFAEVVDRFPDDVGPCTFALIRLGRADEVLTRFSDALGMISWARVALGRFEENLADPRVREWGMARQLCVTGRFDEVAAMVPAEPILDLWQGRAERVLATSQDPALRAAAFAALGRWSEALAEPSERIADEIRCLSGTLDPEADGDNPLASNTRWRLVRLAALGKTAQRDALVARSDASWPSWGEWTTYFVVSPIVREDPVLLRKRLEQAWAEGRRGGCQRPYYLAGVALGRFGPEALDRAPCAGEAQAWKAVARALQAELTGDKAKIRSAWQEYRDLPWHRRIVVELLPDTALEALAQWRTTDGSSP